MLTRHGLHPDSPMKALRTATPALAVIVLTGVAVAWIAGRHATPAEARDARAEGSPALAAGNDPVLRRVAVKQEVAVALLRGEIDLAEAAARFREVNAANPAPFVLLREQYPRAGDDELEFRQVLHFVRWAGRPMSELLPTRLAQLETEFFARFPASDPFPSWFRADRPAAPTGAPGTVRAGRR